MKPLPSTLGLGVSMTVGYGTLYYSFSVLAPEIASEFGWTKSYVFAVFSAGLLSGALAAPIIGRLLDRFGARLVLSLGSLLAAAALALFSVMQNAWQFTAITLLAEFVSLAVQYEAGFSALAERHGREARTHITVVTLVAGFASTVFWPLIQWLLTIMTWRDVYLVLATVNLVLALPVHLLWPRHARREKKAVAAKDGIAPASKGRLPQMALMAANLAGGGFVMSAIGASLLVLLGDVGFSPAVATLTGTLIGPAQVGARLLEYARRSALSPAATALIATGALFSAFALLSVSLALPLVGVALAFGIVYGVGQGLTSIVRGILPLHYFGPEGYGRTTGTLSGIRMVLSAAAPVSIIFINEYAGVGAAIFVLLAVAALSLAAMVALARLPPADDAAAS